MDNTNMTVEKLTAQIKQLQKENKTLKRRNCTLDMTISAVEKIYGFHKNIYNQAKLAMNLQNTYMQLVFDYTPDIILVVGKDYRLINATKNSLLKYGVSVDRSGGKTLYEVFESFAPREQNQIINVIVEESMREGVIKSFDKLTLSFVEKSYVFSVNVVPLIESDEIIGVMMNMHDITDLQSALDSAENASKAKSGFLAKMSHEIRTPMNAILGLSELAMREKLDKESLEHVKGIKQAGNHLMLIINDILDFSKIESGKLEIFPIDYSFSSLLNGVISIIKMRIVDMPILFTVNVDPNIPENLIGDEMRLKQMILNLLTNACKYCERGFVNLEVTHEVVDEETIMMNIEVSDSGIGIKQENMDKLFGDFVQLGGVVGTKTVEGTGLGLAITRGFSMAMGGNISVISEYGVGSAFTISIPQKVNETKKDVFAKVNDDKKNISVLLYETREIYADSLVNSIKNLGVNCNLVITQSDFVVQIERKKYDFVFVSSFVSDSIRKVIRMLGREDVTVILVAEYGESIIETEYTKTLSMPAHSSDLADIFNDCVKDDNKGRNNGAQFIAPTARVLIVDDIKTNLMVAQGLMAPYKIAVELCMNGADSIEMVQKNDYDIVFMDHMMPEMDGVEATARIRNLVPEKSGGRDSEYYKNLPIVALSANAVSGMKEMFLKNGFDDFFAKPINVNVLDSILQRWLPHDKIESFTATETASSDLPSFRIEGVDVSAGIYMTGGDAYNYLKTLNIFREDGLVKIDVLRQCVEKDDMINYAIHVHALKSASASIGAEKVSNLARSLETAAKNDDTDYISKNNEKFIEELTALLESIKYAVMSINTEKKEPSGEIDVEFVAEQTSKLQQAIDAFDMEEVDVVLSLLRTQSDSEMDKVIEEISNCILICEYDKAKELTELLVSE